MELADAKKELRQRMLKLRSQIPDHVRRQQSVEAARQAEHAVLEPLRQRRGGSLNVSCYVSFGDEPHTSPLIENCLSRGDRVLVPKIGAERSLSLHELSGEADLVPGTWGIMEPAEHTAIWPEACYNEIDMMIIPGLAFDLNGGRIGFGAGYYDRLIDRMMSGHGGNTRVILAALALKDLIISEEIPMEAHDFRLSVLFAPDGPIYMNRDLRH
ncbi:5-formyltetrahydrofolate cyclo-ligase [Paenibacillus sanguinis]|uniref:5-formyltetrahydrofolate cyclo-ligase n=1 Tax=Paenibacillus sanguinis TaxID=225906 RepID=UPI000368EBEC|nr:5-formyltetrahydrofolate cyclo-ligase [Paenibacillus sanguinis]